MAHAARKRSATLKSERRRFSSPPAGSEAPLPAVTHARREERARPEAGACVLPPRWACSWRNRRHARPAGAAWFRGGGGGRHALPPSSAAVARQGWRGSRCRVTRNPETAAPVTVSPPPSALGSARSLGSVGNRSSGCVRRRSPRRRALTGRKVLWRKDAVALGPAVPDAGDSTSAGFSQPRTAVERPRPTPVAVSPGRGALPGSRCDPAARNRGRPLADADSFLI
nr:uncharacterized protein LOC109729270 [Microcebus murinus]